LQYHSLKEVLMRPRVPVFVILGIVLVAPMSHAEIPQIISYQGKVTDSGGTPVADGDYSMTFTIYDAATSGTSLWSSGSMTVSVSDGVFSVLLGDAGQPAMNLDFDVDCWLEVNIAGDLQSPRQPLGAVGYAYMASGVVPGTEVNGAIATGAAFKGTNTSGTGFAGIMGETNSSVGYGVWGKHTRTTGQVRGVYGESAANQGRGVMGVATHTTGNNVGVAGITYSTAGTGVSGESWGGGNSVGVFGQSTGTWGIGLKGMATSSTGYAYGVYGENQSTDGAGVLGLANRYTGTGCGVEGVTFAPNGRGVYGHASQTGGTGYGVYGESSSSAGAGVYGEVTSGAAKGVHGKSTSNIGTGVYGEATGTGACCGVRGLATNAGADTSYGVYGEASGNGFGVFGKHTLGGWAGGFDGRVLVDGQLIVGVTTYVPIYPLEVHGSRAVVHEDSTGDWIAMRTDATRLHLSFHGDDLSIQSTTGMEHILLNPSRVAYVGIRTTSPGYELQVGDAGDGTTARANSWDLFSSREYKTDIEALNPQDYADVLRELHDAEVVRYRLINDENEVQRIGLIAEDAPTAIATSDRKGLSLGGYSAFLFAAVKAQQDQIEALEQQVVTLRRELSEVR
jgi:hypothetical protein